MPNWCKECCSTVIEDLPGWLACYCTSREIDGDEEYPDTWVDKGGDADNTGKTDKTVSDLNHKE